MAPRAAGLHARSVEGALRVLGVEERFTAAWRRAKSSKRCLARQ